MRSTKAKSSVVSKTPRPLSAGEETLARDLRAYGIEFEREACLVPGRKWRVDFYCRQRDLAIEVEGVSTGFSRHTTIAGYRDDLRKYNALALAGVRVLRYTQDMVKSGEAIDAIRATLQ